MKYYIYAAETRYAGLYGMFETFIEEFATPVEAETFGLGMAYNVINSYDCTVPNQEFEDPNEEVEWYDEHSLVYLWEIDSKYQSMSVDELNEKRILLGHANFVTQYCRIVYGFDEAQGVDF